MAMLQCGVCGHEAPCREVLVTATGHGEAATYHVMACRSCWYAFNAMLEAQAMYVQLHLPDGQTVRKGTVR